VGQVIQYASPRHVGRLTVQTLTVTPTSMAWAAQDYSLRRGGGQAMPGSFVTGATSNGVNSYQANLRGNELDVETVSRWSTDHSDNIRDFGGGGADFHFQFANEIWKRGTLRKISDDPGYVLKLGR